MKLGLAVVVAMMFASAHAWAVPALPFCDGGAFVACADAGALSSCSTDSCTGPNCACTGPIDCQGSADPVQECLELLTCDGYYAPAIAACAGLDAGASCTLSGATGTACAPAITCYVKGDASFAAESHVMCMPTPASSPADAAPDALIDPGFNAGTGSPVESATPPKDTSDSGCAASPSATADAAFLVGAPLALGLLFARRRRRS